MTAADNLRMLMRYTAWASTRLFDTLAGLPGGAPTLAGMVKTLNHVYLVDLFSCAMPRPAPQFENF